MPKRPRSSGPRDLSDEIVDYAKLVIVAMVCIYVVYEVAISLIGQLPANIASIIIGIGFLYVYTTNKKVRESIMG